MTNTASQRDVRGERYTIVREGGYLRGFRLAGSGMEILIRTNADRDFGGEYPAVARWPHCAYDMAYATAGSTSTASTPR